MLQCRAASAATWMERQLLPSFLTLPAEIRLAIYKLVVPHGHRVITKCEMKRIIHASSLLVKYQKLMPYEGLQDSYALLLVHHICHSEVAPLVYGFNEFYFYGLQGILDWSSRIGPGYVSMIRQLNLYITLNASCSDSRAERAMRNDFHKVLQPMTGLQRLTLWYSTAICTSGMFAPDITFLRRARFVAGQVPWLTRTQHQGNTLRFTHAEHGTDVGAT